MITLEQIANYIENGLNSELNEKNIKFHIWANVGEKDKPFREGNTVTHYITGNLLRPSSSNDANLLVMGINTLTLEVAIPAKRPRTNASQTGADLQKVTNGQYKFVNKVYGAIDKYFQKAQSFSMTDENNVEYSVAMQAGTTLSGSVDISSQLANYVTAYASITLYFVEGGTISKDVTVTFDGAKIPFQVVRIGRSSEMSREVYAGEFTTKALCSSTAFSIDVQFPSNSDESTNGALSFILGGEPNAARFVTVKWGVNGTEKVYLMIFDNVIGNAQGVTIAGITAAFVEASKNAELLNFPESYNVTKFFFENTSANSVTIRVPKTCNAYFGGKAFILQKGEYDMEISPSSYVYDETLGKYYVFLVTDSEVSIGSDIPFEENGKPSVSISGTYRWNIADGFPFMKINQGVRFLSGIGALRPFVGIYSPANRRLNYAGQNGADLAALIWTNDNTPIGVYVTMNFDLENQYVSQKFYDYLIQYATKVS